MGWLIVMSMRFGVKIGWVFCFGLIACMLSFSSITESYGHGLGYEIMPPEMLGSKLVSLEISSDTWPDEYTKDCLLYTSPRPRDATLSRMPSSA